MKIVRGALFALILGATMSACIGDDFVFDTVEPTVRILDPVLSLEQGTNYQFKVSYFNNVGVEEVNNNINWFSSMPDIVSITPTGLAEALQLGTSTIRTKIRLTIFSRCSESDPFV